jgi:aquaporin Z
MIHALRSHWPEYLMEAVGLGLFMISAGVFGTLLENPQSPVHRAIADPFLRRALMGLAMGLTAIGIVYSPWGKQSGAHINPATTLTFWRLGKLADWDAFFYVVFQFLGGLAGVWIVAVTLGGAFTEPPVATVATVPGEYGQAVAFLAELLIAFLTMMVVLVVSNTRRWASWTGLVVGFLIVGYITLESPLSGFSQNPARTFASALPGETWTGIWIYFTAPFLGMLGAAQIYVWLRGFAAVHCAKLHHQNDRRCIFCEFQSAKRMNRSPGGTGVGTPAPFPIEDAFAMSADENRESFHA